MKVNIGKYPNYFGPYQLADALCFWVREVPDEYGVPCKPTWVHKFGEWLAHGSVEPDPVVGEIRSWDRDRRKTLLYRFLLWINKHKCRRIQIQIDPWDTWSMDHTLAHIVLPMLRQLNETKHGAPFVDDEDVPEHLRSIAAPPKQNDYDIDDNHFARWDWVLGEMIWAFAQELDENAEDQFYSGNIDHQFRQLPNGISEMIDGPNHTFEIDREGMDAWWARKKNGFRLFGKYYLNLWD